MKRWITRVSVTFLTLLFILLPSNSIGAADVNCSGIGPLTKIWWDGVELKVGQIGRLFVLENTPLYKMDGDSKIVTRTLKTGENYRIYAFKPGMLSVGGGLFVDRDTRVKYETPSKTKLSLLACKKEAMQATIYIGESKASVESKLGKEKRVSINEYGFQWYTYHEQYKNFYMISYKDNKVAGIYSNSIGFNHHSVQPGATRQAVMSELGTPIKGILKGNINYLVSNNDELQTYSVQDQYMTVFYDIHQQGLVTSIQVLTKEMESYKTSRYSSHSSALQEAFELQMFDITNAERVRKGLAPLSWEERARSSSRKHSADMAVHAFFDHTNLKGESPFDRMENEGLSYRAAGENIAMGYTSSIFAHEALMNSLGHRKNILNTSFTHLGIGVEFETGNDIPYYTQNFLTPY